MNPPDLHNSARRRLGKGVLGSSVVLASITSKNALAASYRCTVSGNMSGNKSLARGIDQSANCKTGSSLSDLKTLYSKSSRGPVLGGGVPFPDFIAVYGQGRGASFSDNTAMVWATPPSLSTPLATYHQLFWAKNVSNSASDPVGLARMALSVYLSAGVTGYHISQQDCINLYKGAKDGSWKGWAPDKCRAHIELLYRA